MGTSLCSQTPIFFLIQPKLLLSRIGLLNLSITDILSQIILCCVCLWWRSCSVLCRIFNSVFGLSLINRCQCSNLSPIMANNNGLQTCQMSLWGLGTPSQITQIKNMGVERWVSLVKPRPRENHSRLNWKGRILKQWGKVWRQK